MTLPAAWIKIVSVALIVFHFFGYGSGASQAVGQQSSASEDTALLPPSSLQSINDAEGSPIDDIEFSETRLPIDPWKSSFILMTYTGATLMSLILSFLRLSGIEQLKAIIAIRSIGLLSGFFCVALIWKLYLSAFRMGSGRLLLFIVPLIVSLLLVGFPFALLLLEALDINGQDLDIFISMFQPCILLLFSGLAVFTFQYSYKNAAKGVLNDLRDKNETVISSKNANFLLIYEDYSILLSKCLAGNAPKLTSQVLSEVYTKNFTTKQMLAILPQTIDNPCGYEVVKFISRRARPTDKIAVDHKLAHAIFGTRNRHILLKELVIAGQLIEDVVILVCLKLFYSYLAQAQ